MREKRNFQIAARKENTREKKKRVSIVEFKPNEILLRFNENIDAVREQFATAEGLVANGEVEKAKYIWRSQIVFCVSALDFYMHEIVKYGLSQTFNGTWKKTSEYRKLPVRLEYVERALKAPESQWFNEFVIELNAIKAFGSYRNICDQLKLIGLDMKEIEEHAFSEEEDPSRFFEETITTIWKRRNQIAHQADRKNENAQIQDIGCAHVETCIRNIGKFVQSVNRAVVEKDEQ